MVKRERIYKKRIFNTLASRSRPERVKQKVDLRQLYNPVGGYGSDKTKVLKLDENLTKYTEQIPLLFS